jgi:hypothetical protein
MKNAWKEKTEVEGGHVNDLKDIEANGLTWQENKRRWFDKIKDSPEYLQGVSDGKDSLKARDAQVLKDFKSLERALVLIQQKIARSKLSDEQQKILIEDIDVAITRFEKLLLVEEAKR